MDLLLSIQKAAWGNEADTSLLFYKAGVDTEAVKTATIKISATTGYENNVSQNTTSLQLYFRVEMSSLSIHYCPPIEAVSYLGSH